MTILISPTVFNDKYKTFMQDTHRTQILYGGAGSGKSYAIAQRIVILSFKKGNNILVARKYANTNRNSTYRLIKNIISTWNLSTYFNVQDMKIINVISNTLIIFIGLDDVEKVKSISGIKIIWILLASLITKDDFIQLNFRLRGRITSLQLHYMIWLSFNPISNNHWIRKLFFQLDGNPRIGCTRNRNTQLTVSYYHSTYKDNKFIDELYIETLLSYKLTSAYHYDVYALGKWGTFGLLVLPNFSIKLFNIPDIISLSGYVISGLDFGYNDPSVCLLVSLHDKTLYVCLLLYGKKWTNSDLAYNLLNTQYIKNHRIYADSALPQRIILLQRRGLDIVGVTKKGIKLSLNNLKTIPIVIHPNCIKTILLISNYAYLKDKSTGLYSDRPIAINDHCMDALRYATMQYFIQRGNVGFTHRGA